MKKKLLTIFILCCGKIVFGQVTNDDCSNAFFLGTFNSTATYSCFDGIPGYDTTLSTSNINAIVNYPYPAMSGCQGYTPLNTNVANDIWYKMGVGKFEIKIASVSGFDSIHLNVWHGQDCSNLNPSGCYTFDLANAPGNYSTTFDGATGSEWTYLQFSGPYLGRTGDFDFCIKELAFTTPVYYGTKSIITNIDNYSLKINNVILYPNPSNGTMQLDYTLEKEEKGVFVIYDLLGKKQAEYELAQNSNSVAINEIMLNNGIYFYKILVNDKPIATDKLIVVK
ncbi:MAG: T9SS type A sorting domain-containing protein [Bacteroidota bacterium]